MSSVVVVATALLASVGGELTWGGIEAHPAVVNPVVEQSAADVVSLRGTWKFACPERERPHRNGVWGKFFLDEWPDARDIQVPGCWEAQGVGEPGDGECWDPKWDNSQKPIRHKYMGSGWYRKDVEIPAAWAGKRIWIKFGGLRSVGWVWVNGNQVALIDNYCATVKYEITDFVKPGETARVVVQVDNRKPSRKGLVSSMHKWGGILRDVELEATPQTFIDDAWVRGDFDRRVCEVHVETAGAAAARVRVNVEGEVAEAPVARDGGETVVALPLRNFRPWSPEHPNLYTAAVDLVVGGQVVHARRERFGVRKIEVRGKEFYLNGRPFFVRGFGDDCVYPITGVSPADRDYHRGHLRKARAAGFNYVRLHTHCELPEYFEAADELGIMIQPELPYYSDVPTEGFAFDPLRDVTELWRNFRRHPSFATYSNGNEGSFGDVLDRRLHQYVKKMDPDRLKINQDTNRPQLSSADRSDYAGGAIKEWPRGSYDPDRPFVTHEYLNLCVKLDSRGEGRYVGAWQPPGTRSAREKWLAQFGLGLDWGDRLQDAQHVLQSVWQKSGIESARIDPFCDGYIFWTIVDVVVWNAKASTYSAQGLFDPFWENKAKGLSAADFAVFNSPSCVLADLAPTQRVFVAGDRLKTDVYLAHYGDAPMRDAKMSWRIAVGDRTLVSGEDPVGDQPIGAVRRIGAIDVAIPGIERSVAASLEVEVGGVRNGWDVWLFPKGASLAEIRARAKRRGVVVAECGSAEAEAAIAAGKPLVVVDGCKGEPNIRLGWWWMGRQVGTAIRKHAVLGDFPHDGALTPLMFRILKQGMELPLAGVKPDDMVVVGEGGEKCYLYLAVRQIGQSRVVECHGLDVLADLPEGNALLSAFIDHLAR